jgi:hypothetical protein
MAPSSASDAGVRENHTPAFISYKTLIPEGFAERLRANGLRSAADALGVQ